MMQRSLVRGPLRAIANTVATRPSPVIRSFSTFPAWRNEESPAATTATNITADSQEPQQQQGRPRRVFGNKRKFDNNSNRRSGRRFQESPAAKFERRAAVPYDTTQPLKFAEPEDWVVSSVLEPRPLYANVAAGNADTTSDKIGASQINPAVNGLRSHGDLDPHVEQLLIQELSELEREKKDHRKKADTKLDHQEFLMEGLSTNFQEIINPKNKINRFNNGGVPSQANVKYEASTDEVLAAGKNEELIERSWKRLEYFGGDYSRVAHPLKHMAAQPPQGIKKAGSKGKKILENIDTLIGQNQSISFEDKKKMLRAVEKGLGGY